MMNMKNNYLKRVIAMVIVSVMLIGTNINVFADVKPYEITVENGRLKKVGHSIEEEHRDLIKAIVNTASDKMTSVYPKTFGHLKGSGITLGLIEDENANSNNRALVSTVSSINHNPESIELGLALEVNMINFRWPGKPISEDNKNILTSVITHEIMHAMMIEALTSGVTGNNVRGDVGGRFPNWFIEGMAVVSGGGTESVDALLSYQGGKHVNDATLEKSDISSAITRSSLVLGREPNSKNSIYRHASYGTGYLACMYLGNLIADDDGDISFEEPNVVKIRAGLDTLMSEIAKGYSLDQAIKNLTKYDGLVDFEENSSDELIKYSVKLIEQIKDGKGSALTDLGSKNVLEPSSIHLLSKPTIALNDNYTRMINKYPMGHIVFKGGTRFNTGYDIKGNYPSDAYVPNIAIKSETIDGIKFDKKSGKITGLTNGIYAIDGQIVSQDAYGTLDGKKYEGKIISIVKKGHNYLKDSEPFKLNIPKKKTISDGDIIFPSASELIYGQKLQDSKLKIASKHDSLGTFKWEHPDTVAEVGNNGYNVVFIPDADKVDDYTNLVQKTKKIKVKVRKATPIIDLKISQSSPQNIKFVVNISKNGFGDYPTGNVELMATSGSSIIYNNKLGSLALNNAKGELIYHTSKQGIYNITPKYSGDSNYNATTGASIKIDTKKKHQVDFEISDISDKIYGDEDFKLSVVGGNGTGAVRFESSDSDIIKINKDIASIKKAGKVKITAIKDADEQYNEVKSEIFVVVGKKNLQVKARDKQVKTNDSFPINFEFDTEGLINGDSFTNPILRTNATNLTKLGTFDIYISGGHFKEDCYNVIYKKGILQVINEKNIDSSSNNSNNNSSHSSKYRSKRRKHNSHYRENTDDRLVDKSIQNKEKLERNNVNNAVYKKTIENINKVLIQKYLQNFVVNGKLFKDIEKIDWYIKWIKIQFLI